MPKKVIPTPMYLFPRQMAELDALAERTRIRRAELVRMAVDMLLAKYKRKGGGK
jgi:hypothetical protein